MAPPLFFAKRGVTAWYPQITATTTKLLRYCSKRVYSPKTSKGNCLHFIHTVYTFS